MKKKTTIGRIVSTLLTLALVWGGVACQTEPPVEAKSFTIKFDVKDIGSISVKEGESAESQKPEDPKKAGYTFVEWQKEDGTAYVWTDPVSADISLTAKWTLAEYTITYLPEGVVTDNPTTYNIESDTITLKKPTTCPSATPNFLRWHENDKDGTVVTEIPKGSTGNKVFYAECTEKSVYKVTFMLREEVIGEGKYVIDGEKLTDFTGYEKYDFIDKEGKAFDFETPITSDTTVYLKLKSLKVTLTIAEGVSADLHVNYGEKITQADLESMTSKIPEKYSSYDFEGLFTDAALENVFDWANTAITENKVLYVKLVKYHTVKFIDGDNTSSIRVADGTVATKPADSVKPGYAFGGWLNGSDVYNWEAPVTTDVTLNANWIEANVVWAPKEIAGKEVSCELPGNQFNSTYEDDESSGGKVLVLTKNTAADAGKYHTMTLTFKNPKNLSGKLLKIDLWGDAVDESPKVLIISGDKAQSEGYAPRIYTANAWGTGTTALDECKAAWSSDNSIVAADLTAVTSIQINFQEATANMKYSKIYITDAEGANEEIIWSAQTFANALSVENPASWSNANASYIEDDIYEYIYKVETTSEVNYPTTKIVFPSPAKDFSAYEYLQITLKASAAPASDNEKIKVSIFTDDTHASEHNGCNIVAEDVGKLKSFSLKLEDFWAAWSSDNSIEKADLSKISNLKIEFGKYVGTVEIAEISLY